MSLRLSLLLLSTAILVWLYVRGVRSARRVPYRPAGSPPQPLPSVASTPGDLASTDHVYVTASGAGWFHGDEIRHALEAADLESGAMDIFHYHGDSTGQPLISAADMYEPGTLRIAALSDLKTRGLVLFIAPGGAGTPAQLIRLAQAVATALSARVYDANLQPIEESVLQRIREDEFPDLPGA